MIPAYHEAGHAAASWAHGRCVGHIPTLVPHLRSGLRRNAATAEVIEDAVTSQLSGGFAAKGF